MKLRPLLRAAAVLILTGLTGGCNLMEGLRQTSPHRSDKPVIFSDSWHAARKLKKEEARRIKERETLEYFATLMARSQP